MSRDVKGFIRTYKEAGTKDGFYCYLTQYYYYRERERCNFCKYNMKGRCVRNLGLWYVR